MPNNPTTSPKIADDLREEFQEMTVCALRDSAQHYVNRCINLMKRASRAEAQVRELQSKLDGQMGPWWIQDMDNLQAENAELRATVGRLDGVVEAASIYLPEVYMNAFIAARKGKKGEQRWTH